LILWLTSSFAASYANAGTCEFKKVTKVRIALAPPYSLKCREIRLDCSGNCRKWAQFRNSRSETGLEKVSCVTLHAVLCPFSLKGSLAVPFRPLHQANAMRSQTDHSAKAELTSFLSPRELVRVPRARLWLASGWPTIHPGL
jgi:hypothetical protein